MRNSRLTICILTVICAVLCSASGLAQEPKVGEKPIRVVTEEIQLNVTAQNSAGHFDPTLVKDDLLVVEDGVPQTISSLRRVPASVLLVLDAGGDVYFAKNLTTTRAAAKSVSENLQPGDALAAMQYSDKPETIADWTQEPNDVRAALDHKLLVGRGSRFAETLNAAIEMFKSRPPENRHLVLITDGLESATDDAGLNAALQNAIAANISIHVISYTKLEEEKAQQATQRVKFGKINPLRVAAMIAQAVSPDLGKAMAREQRNAKVPTDRALTNAEIKAELDDLNKESAESPTAKIGSVQNGKVEVAREEKINVIKIETDNDWIAVVRGKREAWRTSETRLKTLADETGGVFNAPDALENFPKAGGEIADAIGSQYVVSYAPKRPIADSTDKELRQIRVVSRRVGLTVRARQKVILNGAAKQTPATPQ